jgi:tetratricopeptide (TPR) repeat protein
MKLFRNFISALTLTAVGVLVLSSSGCEYARKVIAKDKLNQGAILYNQGRTKAAQEFFKDATETDPNNPVAWLYYGATLVKDYKEVSDESQKKSIANDALKVYEKALSLAGESCTNKDNAISYIATIYDDLNNTDEWRNWLMKRAEDSCATKEVKATTYYTIAVNYWKCSYDQTTRYQDKVKATSEPFHYRNMDYAAALADKQKAIDCTDKGLQYIEKALQIDPEYVDAKFYQGLLYRERQKLTKEEPKRKELDQLAVKISKEATAMQQKKEAEAQQKQSAPQG